MIQRIFTVGGFTMLSRITGFARDVVLAAALGAGPVADAFFVALRLPNHFRAIFAEGAFNSAFVPAYAGLRERGGGLVLRQQQARQWRIGDQSLRARCVFMRQGRIACSNGDKPLRESAIALFAARCCLIAAKSRRHRNKAAPGAVDQRPAKQDKKKKAEQKGWRGFDKIAHPDHFHRSRMPRHPSDKGDQCKEFQQEPEGFEHGA